MPDVLVYQTSDPRFADRAVEAMTQAGISSFRTGSGYADLRPGIRQDLEAGVCIYIRREEDYARANQILRDLGAALDEPVKLPSRRVLFLLALIAAVLGILAALDWR
jgi:hypothetical protein